MYINKVEIENIRSIGRFEMEFPKPAGWHVLIGDNGSGKTTVIRAISLALIGSEQAKGLRLDWAKWLKKDTREGSVILELSRDKNYDWPTISGLEMGDRTSPSDAPVEFKNYISIRQENSAGKVILKSHVDESSTPRFYYNWNNRSAWFSAGFGPFRRFTGGADEWGSVYKNSQLVELGRHLSIFDESVALTMVTEWLMLLKFQKHEHIENYYDSIIELINSDDFLPGQTKLTEVTSNGIEFKDADGQIVSMNELSDGFRSILSLTLELLRHILASHVGFDPFAKSGGQIFIDVPGVVLIDEIDAHLHPTWQTRIGQWFTKYFPKIQFIVTTHSPLVCRASENGSIWRLSAPGSAVESGEITGIEKEKLVYGNILDAYGTEVFGKSAVRSQHSSEKLERLGKLNMLFALNKISAVEETERIGLQKILSTDDPTGF